MSRLIYEKNLVLTESDIHEIIAETAGEIGYTMLPDSKLPEEDELNRAATTDEISNFVNGFIMYYLADELFDYENGKYREIRDWEMKRHREMVKNDELAATRFSLDEKETHPSSTMRIIYAARYSAEKSCAWILRNLPNFGCKIVIACKSGKQTVFHVNAPVNWKIGHARKIHYSVPFTHTFRLNK